MIDQRQKNTIAVTGTPTLTAGALTIDTNQASTYNGPTSFAQATDSTSLSITGSMALEFFFKFASLPGATRDIVSKASSYAAQLNTSGKLLFRIDNGASNVTVTSNATLTTNTYYHVVCVLNQEYAGAETFGKTSDGSVNSTVADDNGNNKSTSMYALPETGILETISLRLQYVDEIWPVEMNAVVYTDSAGAADDLVTTSGIQTITFSVVPGRVYTWVDFSLAPALVPAGDYHIGYVADTVAGIPKAPLTIGRENTGSTSLRRPDSVSSPSDPFGTSLDTGTHSMDIHCDYSAVGRTGLEGKAAIYINGALDNSASYALGIADNSNALQISPSAAFTVDEVSVWDRVLSPLEVATHYLAR